MARKSAAYVLVFLLLCVSLTLICSDFIKNAWISDRSTGLQEAHFTAEVISADAAAKRQFRIEEVTIPTVNEVVRESLDIAAEDVIASIYIPDVGISLPITEGITRAGLMNGAGTVKAEQVPGLGNYGLAGHHMKDDSLLFGPLKEIETGAYIYITDFEYVYTYEVTQKQIVHQRETEVLDDAQATEGIPLITLITCDVSGVNTENRIMVRGELKEQTERMMIAHSPYGAEYVSFTESQQQGCTYTSLLWIAGIMIAAAAVTLLGRFYLR